jgi:hypothetical protein
VTKPIVLKTAKRSHWLVLEGSSYKRIAPCSAGGGGYGAIVTREAFDAAEQGAP